ncbi:hypothetical protein B0O80DRAFT_497166 [Mortierella sp. GBAus27b]|nr:hypothetical protein BGX31_006332 [Mortierella sp. GBA43]KAI8356464.1 hypothetical protein B0O80DRAFT_497166 [Mortierella sp. GBAus27b]
MISNNIGVGVTDDLHDHRQMAFCSLSTKLYHKLHIHKPYKAEDGVSLKDEIDRAVPSSLFCISAHYTTKAVSSCQSKKDRQIAMLAPRQSSDPQSIVIEFRRDANDHDIVRVVDKVKAEGGEITRMPEEGAKSVRYLATVSEFTVNTLSNDRGVLYITRNTDPSFLVFNTMLQ